MQILSSLLICSSRAGALASTAIQYDLELTHPLTLKNVVYSISTNSYEIHETTMTELYSRMFRNGFYFSSEKKVTEIQLTSWIAR